MPRSGLCWLDGMGIKRLICLREPSRSRSRSHRSSFKLLSTITMLSTSTRYSRFAATTTIMVASFSNAAAFSTATSRLTSILNDPSLITCDSPPSQTFDVIDPGASAAQFKDGSAVIAHVRRMGRDDTKDAINRAHIALPDWRDKTTAAYRSGILTEWSSLIKESAEDIAKIMTLESGKPLAESRGEVGYGTSFLDYYAAEAIRPNNSGGGFISPSPFATPDGAPRGKMMAINEAVGVCGELLYDVAHAVLLV
eukprot:scaffold1700_cov129-Skeletonema_dohrnii-CCMP3373.AAC.17